MAIIVGNVRYQLYNQPRLSDVVVLARPRCRECSYMFVDSWQQCCISRDTPKKRVKEMMLQFKNHLDTLPDLPVRCPSCGVVLRGEDDSDFEPVIHDDHIPEDDSECML